MNTQKIYNAQLNVSKCYTTETIEKLINNLSNYSKQNVYYNAETKSIDMEFEGFNYFHHIDNIKNVISQWVSELPCDKNSIDIICNNIDFIYNITVLHSELLPFSDNDIIKIYLY